MKTLREIIREHPFFLGMKPNHVATLMEGAEPAQFKAGEVLFREGEAANRFYLIQSGKVAVEAHEPGQGTMPVQTLRAGDVLGWSWLFPPFVWHFQARTLETTSAIILSGGHLLVAAEDDHDFGYELMKRVAQLTISRLQATRKQLLEAMVESALKD